MVESDRPIGRQMAREQHLTRFRKAALSGATTIPVGIQIYRRPADLLEDQRGFSARSMHVFGDWLGGVRRRSGLRADFATQILDDD